MPKVTGASGDWTAQAHQVEVLTPEGGDVKTRASLAIAWTATDLLLQVHCDDSDVNENVSEGWKSDSIDIALSSSYGSDDRIPFTCNPGRTSDPPAPTWRADDKRASAPPVAAPTMKTEKDGAGYVMTISIPWSNLNHKPQEGDVIGLQVRVNDSHNDGPVTHRIWFPVESSDPKLMQQVKLADNASPPEAAAAWLETSGLKSRIRVTAAASLAGKAVEVWSGAQKIATSLLQPGGADGSTATIPVPDDWAQKKGAPLRTLVDGQVMPATLTVPDLAQARIGLVRNYPLSVKTIFDTPTFPQIDFDNHDLVEAAIGPYTLHTRFFDAQWNEVTAPSAPGRYGALVEFKSCDGLTFTRHVTLFKTAQPYNPSKSPYAVSVDFPAAFGLPADTVAQEQWNVSNWAGNALADAPQDAQWAALIAGLHDIATDPARCRGFNAWKINNDWWSGLGARLGENQDYLRLIHLPDGYEKDQRRWPLILFLHGSGERGTDLNRLQVQGPQGYINKGHSLPFIVVTPLCPADEWWDARRLARLLDQIEAAYRVDPKRIYVTGLSMGGFGSFDFAATYPDRVAAIAPLSGGEDPDLAQRLRKMPAWIFHGADDDVVPTRLSVDLAHAMQKLGAPVKLTIYPGVGHGDWDVTYRNPALYSWFLAHSK